MWVSLMKWVKPVTTQPIQKDIHTSNFPSFIPVMVDEKLKAKTTTPCLLNDELRVSE